MHRHGLLSKLYYMQDNLTVEISIIFPSCIRNMKNKIILFDNVKPKCEINLMNIYVFIRIDFNYMRTFKVSDNHSTHCLLSNMYYSEILTPHCNDIVHVKLCSDCKQIRFMMINPTFI